MMIAKGQPELAINVAGMTIRVLCNDAVVTERLRDWYADFLNVHGSPLVTVEVEVQSGVQFLPLEPGPWVIRSSVQDGQLRFESYFESGWVDLNRARGRLVMAEHASIENFLRVLYAYLGVERDALLVHASGVVKGGKAYVFFGPSGSGKTTTARLSIGHTILSDDMVLLKKANGKVIAYGVPFRGELPQAPRSNVNVELAGLFCLRKDDRHFVVPLDRPRAIAELVGCIPYVMTTPAMSWRVVELCHGFVAKVPAKKLHFRRDAGFWDVIESD
ncbi:MAG: hypothetical protein HY314_16480 [Acidobacteria bacterium]|nr:hypothetical protein [Acidobacteriota bacterium]